VGDDGCTCSGCVNAHHFFVGCESGEVPDRLAGTLGHYGHILGNDHREAVEQIESALSETDGRAFRD